MESASGSIRSPEKSCNELNTISFRSFETYGQGTIDELGMLDHAKSRDTVN
jgi:hypothetical protein